MRIVVMAVLLVIKMVVGRIITVVILMVKIILTITYAILPKYWVLFKHLKYSINLFNPHITPMR